MVHYESGFILCCFRYVFRELCRPAGPHEEIFFYTLVLLLLLASPLRAATISGFALDLDGNGIGGVQVNLTGSSTTLTVTAGDGSYSFSGLVAGNTYFTTPSKSGYVFTPSTRTYAPLGGDTPNQNFIYGKEWNGAGANSLASNPNNWLGGVAPFTGDIARFDGTNATKGCLWDLTTPMEALQIKVTYTSSVVAGVDMVLGSVDISGGEFFGNGHELRLSKNFSQTAGKFRAGAAGTLIWEGTALQTVSMVKTSLGGGLYQNYFANFRVQSSSTVRATSDLIIDETFNISSGRFEAMSATHTLAGKTQSGAGGISNWDDSGGAFVAGSGAISFDSAVGGSYQIRQGASNAFNNLMGLSATGMDALSNIQVNGNLTLGQSGSSVHMNLGNTFSHTVVGAATIGPASTSGSPTLSLGASTVTFQGSVVIGTATFDVQTGLVNVQSNKLEVTSQGTLQVESSGISKFVFGNNSQMKLSGGTLLVQANSVFTSSAVAASRFAMNMNGTVNIQAPAVFDSMDKNGFQMDATANPLNLKNMDFRDGPVGGTALNFNPVSVASVTVDSPIFDVSCSTNVRAILNPAILSNASINVIRSTGAHTGPSFENDPNNIVNWGTIGTPTNFSGTSLGVSSITWTWTIVNNPLGFVVKSSTGGAISPNLGFSATSWTETAVSTNTQYTRIVEAFTDSTQADSASASVYTDAVPASNLAVLATGVSSLTLSWATNTNPAATTFLLERSTDDVIYSQIASGTLAGLVPYTDLNLTPQKLYYYRVKVQNGDGKRVPGVVKTSTSTLPVPPPSVVSITPNTGANLGKINATVIGANIQNGALLRLRRSATQVLAPATSQVQNSTTLTGTFNITGAFAAPWDVEIDNPDGKISVGTGSGLFTVTDAVSNPPITIQTYLAASGLTFTTSGGESSVTMAANVMPDGRVYLSVDPQNTPLTIDPALIATATAKLAGLTLIPNSIREILAFTSQGSFTAGFSGSVTLAIFYPDQNHDGIIDSVSIRASTLRMMLLNETLGEWRLVSDASLDTANNRMSAPLNHFSVYALFGSPASADLSSAKIYPSPWKPGSSTTFDAARLTIANLTEAGTIRIFSLNAELVKEVPYDITGAGVAMWDGKKTDGGTVPSGVYLVQIKSSTGEIKTLKVGIER